MCFLMLCVDLFPLVISAFLPPDISEGGHSLMQRCTLSSQIYSHVLFYGSLRFKREPFQQSSDRVVCITNLCFVILSKRLAEYLPMYLQLCCSRIDRFDLFEINVSADTRIVFLKTGTYELLFMLCVDLLIWIPPAICGGGEGGRTH